MMMKEPVQWKEVWVARTQAGMYVGANGVVALVKHAQQFDTKEELQAWLDTLSLPSVILETTMVED